MDTFSWFADAEEKTRPGFVRQGKFGRAFGMDAFIGSQHGPFVRGLGLRAEHAKAAALPQQISAFLGKLGSTCDRARRDRAETAAVFRFRCQLVRTGVDRMQIGESGGRCGALQERNLLAARIDRGYIETGTCGGQRKRRKSGSAPDVGHTHAIGEEFGQSAKREYAIAHMLAPVRFRRDRRQVQGFVRLVQQFAVLCAERYKTIQTVRPDAFEQEGVFGGIRADSLRG